jgi:hypothetical protein
LLEERVSSGEVKPEEAVLLAELTRRDGGQSSDAPLTGRQFDELLLDPVMVEVMREQADGPWRAWAVQAHAAVCHRRVGDALLRLGGSPMDTIDRRDKRGSGMSEVLFPEREWDVAVSYAGADQAFVSSVVERLEHAGLRVFYAALPEAQSYLWGKELGLVLQTIYREKAAYCLVFVSESYVQSAYTKLEFRTALSRALESDEYVKPVRLDDAELPGLSSTVAFLDARQGRLYADPARLAPVIVDALRNRGEFVPGRRLREPPPVSGMGVQFYFDSVLPAVLRSHQAQAMAVEGSVTFDVFGDESGVWLLHLAPPEARVLHIEPHDDLRSLVLARHLRFRITATQMRSMLAGGWDARRALVEGNLELDGDLTLLHSMRALFVSGE